MDTFTGSWSFDNNWVCPPLHLVQLCSEGFETHEVLLCSRLFDRSAPFWPSSGSFVEDWVDLPSLKSTFCMGWLSACGFGREDLNFGVLALRLISDLRVFLMPVSTLVFNVGVLDVPGVCISLVSCSFSYLFFGGRRVFPVVFSDCVF